MDKDGKGRRNRKDKQSRDYTCLCGKSYLSYAAAYTHTKNKHDGDKKFINGIKKPMKEQLKRGRPKQKKVSSQTTQTAVLTLIQSAILKICEQLDGAFPKIILEGNQQRDNSEYDDCFKSLCEQNGGYLEQVSFDLLQQDFLDALIKDFRADVAARVKFATGVLSGSESEQLVQNVRKLNQIHELWTGRVAVNQTIAQALRQWWKLKGRFQQNEEEDIDINE